TRETRNGSESRPRPGEHARAELVEDVPIPPIDPAAEASTRGDDLPLLLDDVALQLDLPQLVVEPERQVPDATGMDTAPAGIGDAEGVLEIRRHELDDLDAGEFPVQSHCMYSSSARRSFVLARCKSTR